MADDGDEEVDCHELLESFGDAERVEAQSKLADGNEKHAIICLLSVFDLFPHLIAHVCSDEHVNGDVARLEAVFFGLDEGLSNPDMAQVAYSFLFERRNTLLLFKLLQSSNVRIVVADVLPIECVDQRHRHLQRAALRILKV